MKLGTKGRYAVMAMLDLAKFSHAQKPISLSDISGRQEISLSYLEQLFCRLRRAGLVHSARGAMGGYFLAKDSAHLSIGEIVKAADEPLKLTRCSVHTGAGCMSNSAQCLTHHLWESLGDHMMDYLKNISLKDVLNKKLQQAQWGLQWRHQPRPLSKKP